jgi:5'-3' exonuclease
LKSQHGYEQIKTAIVTVAQELEKSTKSDLILSSDRLTLHLGEETLSLPLEAKSLSNVTNWPAKIGKSTP